VQRENSATKIKMVGKKGNTKLLSEITKKEKDHGGKRQPDNAQQKLDIRFIIS